MFDSLITSLLGVADNITATILSFIAMASISMGGAMLLFSLFAADMLIGVGLALGPILLGLSVFSTFRGLLSNWINFMLGAMGTKIVVTIIAATIVKSMQSIQFTGLDAATAGAAFANTGAMMGIIFLGIIVTFLAKEASSIASGLFGGIAVSALRLPEMRAPGGGGSGGGTPKIPGAPGGGSPKPPTATAPKPGTPPTPTPGKPAAVGRVAGRMTAAAAKVAGNATTTAGQKIAANVGSASTVASNAVSNASSALIGNAMFPKK